MQRRILLFIVLAGVFVGSRLLFADRLSGRYAVILSDPPVAQRYASQNLKGMRHSAAQDYRQQIRTAQASLRRELERRNIHVTGAVQVLLNAVFVQASEEQAAELRILPGVKGVVPIARMHLNLNKAVPLVHGPDAWTELGGVQNAGAGMKIAMIDTGIDQTHPAFQDPSLSVPSGFPKCEPQDCAFTNNKVIVARSYVKQLAAGTSPNPAADSRPDDYSPRDHVGHGTATAMTAAGLTNTGPAATITGMAPKAWLGSYKVFGSPGVNDDTSGDVVISALEDALNDGMDVASLSLGAPAFFGPLDEGQICGQSSGTPCDPEAAAVQNAVLAGMAVVVAAGNEGDTGIQVNIAPTLNTIDSPATAPAAIAVGASTNAHTFTQSVRVPGSGVPTNLQQINALFGDGPVPSQPLTAPLRDVTTLGDNGLACLPLPSGSLAGSIALIERGTCLFQVKVTNAQNAGAVGVVIYLNDTADSISSPGGLSGTSIPAAMIGNSDGLALKSYLSSHPDTPVTLDPTLVQVDVSTFNIVASFSSHGPSITGTPVKPELAAVGTQMYMATQDFDPNGEMYSTTRYTVADGTSFATPMVSGAAALVKQNSPNFTPLQMKSALISTATQDVTEGGVTASVISVGAGKLDAATALQDTVTLEPTTLSFGELAPGDLPLSQQVTVQNAGTSPVNLPLAVNSIVSDPNVQVTLDKTSLSLNPGQSGTVTVSLTGGISVPGVFEGAVTIQGAATPLRLPYLYLAGDGIPFDLVPMAGSNFEGQVGESGDPLAFKVIDQYGVPIYGVPVLFGVSQGGGSIDGADPATDIYGIATASVTLGSSAGAQQFVAQIPGGLTLAFDGVARVQPVISSGGVVNAASFQAAPGIAPGSYISIFGQALSDVTQTATTANLQPSLGGVSVSFDVPSANLSLPGYVYYVSPGQVNIQVPWELSGQNSVVMKVSVGAVSGALYTATVSEYSPAVFEYTDPTTGHQYAAALDENNQLITASNAARPGHDIQLFLNGLGRVDNPPPSGLPAPLEPLTHTLVQPVVTIGGQNATVQFSGLAPLISGLYQVNVTVPQNAPAGVQPLRLTIGGVTAKTVNLPVE